MQPKSPEYVSKFRDKVRELYEWAWDNQRDAAGNVGTVRLASLLGSVGPNGIAMWVGGVEPQFKASASHGTARVPRAHFEAICNDIFGIPEAIFRGEYQEFKDWLRQHPHTPPATWKDFAARGEITSAFRLTSRRPAHERGLALPAPGDLPDERFRVDDEVCVELDLSVLLPTESHSAEPSLILLVEDAEVTECIYPSANELMRTRKLAAGMRVRLPEDGRKWIRVTSPVGVQSLFAVLTERSVARDVTSDLLAGVISPSLLNRLARRITALEFGKFKALKRPYAVS